MYNINIIFNNRTLSKLAKEHKINTKGSFFVSSYVTFFEETWGGNQ